MLDNIGNKTKAAIAGLALTAAASASFANDKPPVLVEFGKAVSKDDRDFTKEWNEFITKDTGLEFIYRDIPDNNLLSLKNLMKVSVCGKRILLTGGDGAELIEESIEDDYDIAAKLCAP